MTTLEEFKKRFIRQLVVAVVLLPAIIIFVMMRREEGQVALQEFLGLESNLILYGAIGLVFVGLLFTAFNWRCPACDKYLKKDIYPKHCSGCGVQLHD